MNRKRPAEPPDIVLREGRTGRWLTLSNAERIVTTCQPGEVGDCLREIESCVATQGMTAAGFLAYEAAPAFDPALTVHRDSSGFPLLWFGLFRQPRWANLPEATEPLPELAWRSTVTPEEYGQHLRRILEYIASGDTYQVNYSYRLRASFRDGAWPMFLRLVAAHRPEFGGYLHIGRWTILSLSPELFFRLDGERIESIPMKGTIGRGLSVADDRAQAQRLRNSCKDRAENVMIVDMVRNDLGRIALPGSVRTEELFAVCRYPTLWQMTSTVTAQVRTSLPDMFAALFPAASITGAPKARTMALITELETSPRRIYTGTIGFLLPDGRAQFNVAIRTLLLDRQHQSIEYGVGGGIVADSTINGEWEETRIKSLICRSPRPEFFLLETLLWTPASGFILLAEHLCRLVASAEYFSCRCDLEEVRRRMTAAVAGCPWPRCKVRVLLDRRGALRIETAPMPDPDSGRPVRLVLAAEPIDRRNVFLYHKTTCREHYEQARTRLPLGVDDVLFHNQHGEITETTIANVVVVIGGRRYTPPVRCGLLPGTLRQSLLEAGEIEERVLPVDIVQHCDTLYLINSVRGQYAGVLLQWENGEKRDGTLFPRRSTGG